MKKKKKKRLSVLSKIPRISTNIGRHSIHRKRQDRASLSGPRRETFDSFPDDLSLTEESSTEDLTIKSANNSSRNSLGVNYNLSVTAPYLSDPNVVNKDDLFSLDRQLNSITNEKKTTRSNFY